MDITVTLGPSSWDEAVILGFLDLGVAAFRFPFAKETPADHLKWGATVRQLANRCGRRVDLLADLPGSKPRLTNQAPLDIVASRRYRIQIADECNLPCDLGVSPPLSSSWRGRAIVGDGENEFTADTGGIGWVEGTFKWDGLLERRRSFVVDTAGAPECFSASDRELARRIASSFDGLVLSFASDASQVSGARAWLRRELAWTPRIIAKIETRRGVEQAPAIAHASDAVLLGRGDLALQIGQGGLWRAQKAVVDACLGAGRHMSVGTGVLQSMRWQPFPSRAECIDVMAAIELGVNGFMFSTETAIGRWPVDVVRTLTHLIAEAQQGGVVAVGEVS